MTKSSGKKIVSTYTKALVAGFVSQAESIAKLEHNLTKGQIREVFLQGLLKHFLPEYLGVGTGIIINTKAHQSKQTDIVIYDSRILPPLLVAGDPNIFPVEAVVAVVEVKSILTLPELRKTEKAAGHLVHVVFKENVWLGKAAVPLYAVFGLSGSKIRGLSTENNDWVTKNIKNIPLICSVGKFSWAKMGGENPGWRYGSADKNYKEIRRFIALLIDNIRTISNKNWAQCVGDHKDWLGQYIRDE
jgi:hypothetical protein